MGKVYAKEIKSYVYHCLAQGGKMQLPGGRARSSASAGASSGGSSAGARSVALTQPYVCVQLLVSEGAHFTLELTVADTDGGRHRLVLSTSFVSAKTTGLHAQIPLSGLPRGEWTTLAIHVADLVHAHCGGRTFKHTEGITLGAAFRLRRIFTTRRPPPEERPATAEGASLGGRAQWALPRSPLSAAATNDATAEPLQRRDAFPGGVQPWCVVLDARRVAAAQDGPGNYSASAYEDTHASGAHAGADGGGQHPPSERIGSAGSNAPHLAFGRRYPKPSAHAVASRGGREHRGERAELRDAATAGGGAPSLGVGALRLSTAGTMSARGLPDEDSARRGVLTAPSSPHKMSRSLPASIQGAGSRAQTARQLPSEAINASPQRRALTARLAHESNAGGSPGRGRRGAPASRGGIGTPSAGLLRQHAETSPERAHTSRMGGIAEWRRHGFASQMSDADRAEPPRNASRGYVSANYAGQDEPLSEVPRRERRERPELASLAAPGGTPRVLPRGALRESVERQQRASLSLSPPRGPALSAIAGAGVGGGEAAASAANGGGVEDAPLLNIGSADGPSDWMGSAVSSRYGTPRGNGSSSARGTRAAVAASRDDASRPDWYGFKVTPRVQQYRRSSLGGGDAQAAAARLADTTPAAAPPEIITPALAGCAEHRPSRVSLEPPRSTTPLERGGSLGFERGGSLGFYGQGHTDPNVLGAPPLPAQVPFGTLDTGSEDAENAPPSRLSPAPFGSVEVSGHASDDGEVVGDSGEHGEVRTGDGAAEETGGFDASADDAPAGVSVGDPADAADAALAASIAAAVADCEQGDDVLMDDPLEMASPAGSFEAPADGHMPPCEPEQTMFVAELDALGALAQPRVSVDAAVAEGDAKGDPRQWAAPTPVPVATLPSAMLHRALTPPVRLPGVELGSGGDHSFTSVAGSETASARVSVQSRPTSVDGGEGVDLLYDPILACYFDPKTNQYYELNDEPSAQFGGGDAAPSAAISLQPSFDNAA